MGLLGRLFGRGDGVANAGLEDLMRALGAGVEPARLSRFYGALLESRLLLPTPALEAQGLTVGRAHVAGEETTIRFVAQRDAEGRGVLVAFTSDAAVRAWRPAGCDTIALAARDLFTMAVRAGLHSAVLNPAGPSGGAIAHSALLSLAEGVVPAADGDPAGARRVDPGRIALERPSTAPPAPLVERVRAQLAASPAIRAAYFVRARIGDGEPHAMLALELDGGAAPDAVIPPFVSGVQPALPAGEYLDVLPLGPEGPLLAAARVHGVRVTR
jgi:SseB protein N-terminal domain/SseB protein C-terminal domain